MEIELPHVGKSLESGWHLSPMAASLLIHIAIAITILSIPSHIDRPPTVAASAALLTPLFYRPVILTQPAHRQVRITQAKVVAPAPKPMEPMEPKVLARQSPFLAPEPPRPRAVTVQMPEVAPQQLTSVAGARLEAPTLPARAAVPVPVKVGAFGSPGDSPNGRVPAVRLDVRTGGFDGNAGAPAGRSGTASGNGTHAAIQTGGFGDATGTGAASSAGSGKRAVVADAGFGNVRADAPPQRHLETAPAETPVEVLWKPKPRYTEEARAKKLEGDVVLEVVFRAAGDVRVIRVVRGLGGGLDESARTAAEQIRFRPGKRDGVPIDRTGLVQITFERT